MVAGGIIRVIKLCAIAGITLLVCLPTAGCSFSQITGSVKEWTNPRHLVPVPMRRQIFNNAPTGDLKSRQQYAPTPNELVPGIKEGGYHGEGGYADEEPRNEYNDDSYGAGFEAGCGNFVGVVGTGSMRLIKPKIDAHRLTTDQWYLRGYQDASSWCTFNLDWELH